MALRLLGAAEWFDADFRAIVESLRPELPELATTEWLAPDNRTALPDLTDRWIDSVPKQQVGAIEFPCSAPR